MKASEAVSPLSAAPMPAAALPPASAGAPPGATARTLRRGGVTYATTQYLGMTLGFIGSTLMVRMASPQDVASYLLLLQAITAVGLTMQLGLGPAALRFAPVTRGAGGTAATALLRRRLFRIQVLLWLAIVPPLALAWPWIARRLESPELAKASPLLVAAAVLASFGNLADNYLRAFRLYTASALFTHFMARAFLLAGFVTLWLLHSREIPWEVLISIYMAAQLAAALGYAISLRLTTPGETSEPRAAQPAPPIREILGATTAMGLRSAASVLFVSSDLWVLAWARPHAEVAVYGIASRVLQIMGAIPGVANSRHITPIATPPVHGRADGGDGGAGAHRLDLGGDDLGGLLSGSPPRRPAADPPRLRPDVRGELGDPAHPGGRQLLGHRLGVGRLRAADERQPQPAARVDRRRGGAQLGAEPRPRPPVGGLRRRRRDDDDADPAQPRHGLFGAAADRRAHVRLSLPRALVGDPALAARARRAAGGGGLRA